MNNEIIKSLERFVTPSLIKNLIYSIDDKKYVLFEQYVIDKKHDYYIVYRYRDDKMFEFNKLRNATTWIILDKFNKFYEAARVIDIDKKLYSISIEKNIHARILRKAGYDDFLLYSVKLQEDIISQKKFQNELDKYIIMAINCQQKGFENELTRTSRAQKDKVNH